MNRKVTRQFPLTQMHPPSQENLRSYQRTAAQRTRLDSTSVHDTYATRFRDLLMSLVHLNVPSLCTMIVARP